MSAAYRNLIALEAKSGGGLLRSGRSGPNTSSILAAGMRAWHGAGTRVHGAAAGRSAARLGRLHDTINKLERTAYADPKRTRRAAAAYALVGVGGAYTKRRKEKAKMARSNRKLAHEQRRLRHFGG